MVGFLIVLLTILLVLTCLVMGFLILLQKPTTPGMGAAIGGSGMAESAFGTESSTVLRKSTIVCAVVFFVLAFGLYLFHISAQSDSIRSAESLFELPVVEAEAEVAPEAEATEATEAAEGTTEDSSAELLAPAVEVLETETPADEAK